MKVVNDVLLVVLLVNHGVPIDKASLDVEGGGCFRVGVAGAQLLGELFRLCVKFLRFGSDERLDHVTVQ